MLVLSALALGVGVVLVALGLRRQSAAAPTPPSAPPLELTVVPYEGAPPSRNRIFRRCHDGFVAAGFEPVGDYRFLELPDYRLHLFLDETAEWVGIVYEHPLTGVWCDVFTWFRDGDNLTVSSAPFGEALETPPGWRKILHKGAKVEGLVAEAFEVAGDRPRRGTTAERLPRLIEETYAEEMAWRASRERTQANVRRLQLLQIEEAALGHFRSSHPDAPPENRLMAVPETLTGQELLARIEARHWVPRPVSAELASRLPRPPATELEGMAPAGDHAFRLLDHWLDDALEEHGVRLIATVDRPVPTRILEKLPEDAPPPDTGRSAGSRRRS